MCIKETKSYEYKGVLYVTEIAAVQAGLIQMSNDLMKNWSSRIDAGLVKNAEEIIYLLQKRRELDQRAQEAQILAEVEEAISEPDYEDHHRTGIAISEA